METLETSPLAALPAVRVLGRHTSDHPETLFWTAGGLEMLYTGSELWVEWEADYSTMEPWVSVELNGESDEQFHVTIDCGEGQQQSGGGEVLLHETILSKLIELVDY